MSAAPNLQPFPEGLPTRQAAPLFGVSETTLRRAMKAAAEKQPHATIVEGECRGIPFRAWRDQRLPRAPWRVVLFDHEAPPGFVLSPFEIKSADNRIRDLRSAIRTNFNAAVDASPALAIDAPSSSPAPANPGRKRRWQFWKK